MCYCVGLTALWLPAPTYPVGSPILIYINFTVEQVILFTVHVLYFDEHYLHSFVYAMVTLTAFACEKQQILDCQQEAACLERKECNESYFGHQWK